MKRYLTSGDVDVQFSVDDPALVDLLELSPDVLVHAGVEGVDHFQLSLERRRRQPVALAVKVDLQH